MAAVTEDPISLWLKLGALEKLEQVVLDGYGDQLYGKTSRIPQVNKFLRQVPFYQNKIDEIHRAVSMGNVREVQHLIDRKKLAFCRDPAGASPMHKAVLFSQKPILNYLLARYSSVVHARDHRGRTPLHYAAVLQDQGEIYRLLLEHGADYKATDVYGNRAEYYLQRQDEMNLQNLKQTSGTNHGIKKEIKTRKYHAQVVAAKDNQRSAKPSGSRVQIRELINNCQLESLEDLVIQGHGDKLLGESAPNLLIQDFLNMVPIYMERIYDIHRAVARGRLRDVQTLLDRRKFALSRDPLGATPLHKAVMYGHFELAQYIAQNYPLTKDAKDLDGRNSVHYAAVLKDKHEMYNMLVSLGANPVSLDHRGKTAEYYMQFPEHMHLEQMIKQSQRANANYMANNTNRIKLGSPKRRSPYPSQAFFPFDSGEAASLPNGDAKADPTNASNGDTESSNSSVTFKLPKKTLFRSQPILPPAKLKRLDINSANIQKWIKEEDVAKLESAILEGYGDKVAKQKTESIHIQKYLDDHVPKILKKIEAIHTAVSNDNLTELQSQLINKDHMVLAKDNLGMAPIHRAVLMNKVDMLRFLIDRYPETLNARDKEGRTSLHYAAAMSRGTPPGQCVLQRMLLEAGADPRIRDNQGRTAEYYRTHHVPIPNKLAQLPKTEFLKKHRSKSEPPPQQRPKKLVLAVVPSLNPAPLPQSMMDKLNQWLQNGELEPLKEFVHDGYGKYLLGRTSWNDEVRQYLKTIPTYLSNMDSLFQAAQEGDVESVDKYVTSDGKMLRARDETGITVFHHAILHDRFNVVNYFLGRHPTILNIRDRFGRSPLHVSGQQKNPYLYTVLLTSGADPMIMDNKGRTAEFYAKSMQSKTSGDSSGSSDAAAPTAEDENGEEVKNSAEDRPKIFDTPALSLPEEDEEQPEERAESKPESVPAIDAEVVEEPQTAKADSFDIVSEAEKDSRESLIFKPESSQKDVSSAEKLESAPMSQEAILQPRSRLNSIRPVSRVEISESKEPLSPEWEEEAESGDKLGNPVPVPESAEDNKENYTHKKNRTFSEESDFGRVPTRHSNSSDRLNELIELWIQEKDLLRLEHVVIAGQGERLVGRSSEDRQVQEFLELVPTYMARIRGVHDAVVRGNIAEVESVLTRKRFALSRDHLGASPLHLAVLHGHTDIVQYIIDNFPEALDGPDNEGKTPLHYAAVVRDGGNLYRLLKRSGADETIIDKLERSPEYYLTHPGSLTIRDLLESYRIPGPDQRRPSQVNIWQRPPTREIEHRLTPPMTASLIHAEQHEESQSRRCSQADVLESEEQEVIEHHHHHNDHNHHNDHHNDHHHHSDHHIDDNDDADDNEDCSNEHTATEGTDTSSMTEIFPETIYPILFDRQNKDSAYLASVLGDALIKGLTHVAQKRPDDPVGYLATWLYQYASRSSRGNLCTAPSRDNPKDSNDATEVPQSAGEDLMPTYEDNPEEPFDDDEDKITKEDLRKSVLEILQEEDQPGIGAEPEVPNEDPDDMDLELDDNIKMKDEEGQTVLHFAAARAHPNGSFIGLLSQAENLMGERDHSYRSCRDVAEECGHQENVEAIDRYIFDGFVQQKAAVIQLLAHEGYDHLADVRDSQGRDITTYLQYRGLSGPMSLLQDVKEFTKQREELHTYIRHSYFEGVSRLVKLDSTLVTAKNKKARCALHIAVLYEHLDIIEAIVKAHAAAVHIPDNLGRTPLHYAMAMRRVEQIAKVLVKAGALRSVRDSKMRTPSYYFINKEEIQKLYEEELRHN